MRGVVGMGARLAPLALVAALTVAALDGELGVRSWMHLRGELADAQARIAGLRDEVSALEREAELLEDDAFAIERAIREELELVRPGQKLVRLGQSTSPRIP